MLNSDSTLAEIRAKYDTERDKRVRVDRNDQFTAIAGDLEDLGVDPQADASARTVPITDWTEVVIIGAGFGGLTVAGRLKAAGVQDLRIVEKGRWTARNRHFRSVGRSSDTSDSSRLDRAAPRGSTAL